MTKKQYYRPKEKYREEAHVLQTQKIRAMRVHLRKTLEDFLSAMNVREGDEQYEELVSIWCSYHED